MLLVVAAQDHEAVARDVDSCGFVSDDEVREFVHECVCFARLGLCGVEDDEVFAVVTDGETRPYVGVVDRELSKRVGCKAGDLLDVAYRDTHLCGDEARVERRRRWYAKRSALFHGGGFAPGLEAPSKQDSRTPLPHRAVRGLRGL